MVQPATLSSFKEELARLVAHFSSQQPYFSGPDYNEAKLREDFLNPFFAALGWDVGNRKGLIHTEREVDIEVRTEISGKQKRADYVFRIARLERFTCEAKKPAETLHNGHAYQAKRDAYARGIPFALLSDFEDSRFYIVGSRPHRSESVTVGQWKQLHFSQYLDSATELWDLLAYENVQAGSLDRLIDALPKRATRLKARQGYLIRPDRTRSLDAEFLNFLDEARQRLGSDLLKHNDRDDLLAGNHLNEAAQRILDRLVFLRICEDRGIDTGTLLSTQLRDWYHHQDERPRLKRGAFDARKASLFPATADEEPPSPRYAPPAEGGLYRTFVAHVRALDQRPPSYQPFFNGQLFKPHFSEDLVVGDEWLANFIDDLTADDEGYNFADIKVEILGDAYERFLGKVLRPQGRGATIEEKPEVRKAGGVYYTPRYIVDYIVEQTVGRQLEGKTPAQVAKLHFLDPACGSGSFLIRVYERVMEHHLRHFTQRVSEAGAGKERPDTAVAPLLSRHKDDFYIDLVGNVRLTTRLKRQILQNNVYGVDIDAQAVEVTQLSLYLKMLEGENRESLHHQTKDLFKKEALLPPLDQNIKCGNSLIGSDFSLDPAELVRINAFDWDVGFEKIMASGGFDAVVGNPPWIDLKGFDPTQIDYFFKRYDTSENRMNVYSTFMHRSLDLVRAHGFYGVITPSSYLTQSSYTQLRSRLLRVQIQTLIRTPDDVFDGVTAETAISILHKRTPTTPVSILIYPNRARLTTIGADGGEFHTTTNQSSWENGVFNLRSERRITDLLQKISTTGQPLETLCEFCLGLTPYDKAKGHSPSEIEGRVFHSPVATGKAWKPILDGADVSRYRVQWGGKELIKYGPWLGAPRDPRFFSEPRIVVRQIISGKPPRIYAGYSEDELYNSQVAFNLLPRRGGKQAIKSILAILCSRLMTWYHRHRFLDLNKTTFQKILIQDARQFPVLDLFQGAKLTPPGVELAAKTDRMISLTTAALSTISDTERAALENAIRKTDRDIDQLVYQLYGLTPEEIALVEGTAEAETPATSSAD